MSNTSRSESVEIHRKVGAFLQMVYQHQASPTVLTELTDMDSETLIAGLGGWCMALLHRLATKTKDSIPTLIDETMEVFPDIILGPDGEKA